MTRISSFAQSCTTFRQGFSLIETIVSIVIVGVLFAASLNLVGSSRMTDYTTAVRQRGYLLAEALMAEILQQQYQDSNETPVFGCDLGENIGGTRINFDDIDDYDGWSEKPLRDRNGTKIANCDGWKRHVKVDRISGVDLNVVAIETGLKMVTVTAIYKNFLAGSLTAIRARVRQDPAGWVDGL